MSKYTNFTFRSSCVYVLLAKKKSISGPNQHLPKTTLLLLPFTIIENV